MKEQNINPDSVACTAADSHRPTTGRHLYLESFKFQFIAPITVLMVAVTSKEKNSVDIVSRF